jgi:hypothetical protein
VRGGSLLWLKACKESAKAVNRLPQSLQVLLQVVEVVEAAVLGNPQILVTLNFLCHSELVLPPRESL